MNKLTLKEWIDKEGVYTVAKLLRVTDACVRHWRRGYVLPEAKTQARIMEASRGAVSFDMTVTEHYAKENSKNRWKKQ